MSTFGLSGIESLSKITFLRPGDETAEVTRQLRSQGTSIFHQLHLLRVFSAPNLISQIDGLDCTQCLRLLPGIG